MVDDGGAAPPSAKGRTVPPARQTPRRGALGVVGAFVALLTVTGVALLVGAKEPEGRIFGAVQLAFGAGLLALLWPVWRGPRPPGPGPDE
jgi:hypothetical protein